MADKKLNANKPAGLNTLADDQLDGIAGGRMETLHDAALRAPALQDNDALRQEGVSPLEIAKKTGAASIEEQIVDVLQPLRSNYRKIV